MFDEWERGWVFDPDPDDALLMGWVSAALGEDEAARAMSIPADTRAKLYGSELRWGPATEQVEVFLVALSAAVSPLGDAKLLDALTVLSDAETVAEISLRIWIGNTLVYYKLADALYEACPELQGQPWDVLVGVSIVVWMLNLQYLVTPAVATREDALVLHVNDVLALAGCPALDGAFAFNDSWLPA